MQSINYYEAEDCPQQLDSKAIQQLLLAGVIKDCVGQISRDELEELFLDLLDHTIATNDWLKSMAKKGQQPVTESESFLREER